MMLKDIKLEGFFTQEELEREKQLPPLTKEEDEILSKISNAIIDRIEEEIAKQP